MTQWACTTFSWCSRLQVICMLNKSCASRASPMHLVLVQYIRGRSSAVIRMHPGQSNAVVCPLIRPRFLVCPHAAPDLSVSDDQQTQAEWITWWYITDPQVMHPNCTLPWLVCLNFAHSKWLTIPLSNHLFLSFSSLLARFPQCKPITFNVTCRLCMIIMACSLICGWYRFKRDHKCKVYCPITIHTIFTALSLVMALWNIAMSPTAHILLCDIQLVAKLLDPPYLCDFWQKSSLM